MTHLRDVLVDALQLLRLRLELGRRHARQLARLRHLRLHAADGRHRRLLRRVRLQHNLRRAHRLDGAPPLVGGLNLALLRRRLRLQRLQPPLVPPRPVLVLGK